IADTYAHSRPSISSLKLDDMTLFRRPLSGDSTFCVGCSLVRSACKRTVRVAAFATGLGPAATSAPTVVSVMSALKYCRLLVPTKLASASRIVKSLGTAAPAHDDAIQS